MADLAGLIKRLEGLTGPNREVDAEICSALHICPDFDADGFIPPITFRINPDRYGWVQVLGCNGMSVHSRAAYPLTASLDAAIALVERCLPGWARGFDAGPKSCIAFVDPHDYADRMFGARHVATASTPAIAMCLALLRAMQKEERHETGE